MSEKLYLLLTGAVLGVLGVVAWKMRAPISANAAVLAPPSVLAKWPLGSATSQLGPRGVSHTSARDADGTDVDMLEFDFAANPKLRLELFDQDSDDAHPFDNHARYWGRNAAYILAHESNAAGVPIAVCNGGPFEFDHVRTRDEAWHLAPVVEGGRVHFPEISSAQSQLWTLGVRDSSNSQGRFETMLRPSSAGLKKFRFATGGVQCLVRDGAPLSPGEPPSDGKWAAFKAPTISQAGDLGRADWTKTSRVSLGWSRDGGKLWMLCVHDPQAESASRVALSLRARGQADASTPPFGCGWSLRDVQNFWKSKGAWGAVALASGDFAQFAARRSDGQIEFVPSHVAGLFWKSARGRTRLTCSPSLKGAPTGGSALFYWLVREKK